MNWKKELADRITTIASLSDHIPLNREEKADIPSAMKIFPMAIPPYYASLMDKENPDCPIRKQAIPDVRETIVLPGEFEDPLGEEADSPVPGITRRYPDRALFLVTTNCFMFCRHCNRRRKVGDASQQITDDTIETALQYLAQEGSINDVLVSGGDPLFLETEKLDWILQRLREIPHVRTIRIGTRAPVVMPSRITNSLVAVLKNAHPLWLNTHFNHPKEITAQSIAALAKLADGGIPLGNQTVLLRGVNDCPNIIKELCVKLVEHRVRPYYLFQCDLAQGIAHFRTRISSGIEIMESLIGHVRGYAVPTYAVDPPGGAGKIPLTPNYLISQSESAVVLRNYEGVLTKYFESPLAGSNCPSKCTICHTPHSSNGMRGADHGVSNLLTNPDQTSLVPSDTLRAQRKRSVP